MKLRINDFRDVILLGNRVVLCGIKWSKMNPSRRLLTCYPAKYVSAMLLRIEHYLNVKGIATYIAREPVSVSHDSNLEIHRRSVVIYLSVFEISLNESQNNEILTVQ